MMSRFLYRVLSAGAVLGSVSLAGAAAYKGGRLLFEVAAGGLQLTPAVAGAVVLAALLTLLFGWLARRYLPGMRDGAPRRVVVIDQHGRQEMSPEEALRYATGGASTEERLAEDLRAQEARVAKAEMAIAMSPPLDRDETALVLTVVREPVLRSDIVPALARHRPDLSQERLQELADWAVLSLELLSGLGAMVARHRGDQAANAERLGKRFPAADAKALWQIVGHFARMES